MNCGLALTYDEGCSAGPHVIYTNECNSSMCYDLTFTFEYRQWLSGQDGNVRWRSLLRLRLRCPACRADRQWLSGQDGNVRWRSLLRLRLHLEACGFSPASAGVENATAGSEASRSTESALSQRTCELRKVPCESHRTSVRAFLSQAMPGSTERTANRLQPVGAQALVDHRSVFPCEPPCGSSDRKAVVPLPAPPLCQLDISDHSRDIVSLYDNKRNFHKAGQH